ncbi:predicted protein [Uncinocarpus reesii 1704]|uniref:Uncharacterized protein n=1 Tax=Uncinocarpus reesii (strain UAMH 1704) TaxID=336963 RepID=C4JI10_UNCRE|nr:uncharacterized protein UREG_01435 [Uncinocarpus reesii 1704]EEP76586.1 predicted protein [Uncinocarpus reesii 1704]
MEPSQTAAARRLPAFSPIRGSQSGREPNSTTPGTKSKPKHRRHLSHRAYLHAHFHNGLYLPDQPWVQDHLIGGEDSWTGQRDLDPNLDGRREKHRRLRPHRRHRSHDGRLGSRQIRNDMAPGEARGEARGVQAGSSENDLGVGLPGEVSEEIGNEFQMDNVIRLPFVQREEYIRLEDVERQKQKRKDAEKSNSVALSSLADQSLAFSQRLDTAYYNLLDRLSSIRSTIRSFHTLRDLTTSIDTDFNSEAAKLTQSTRKQIADFQGFTPQIRKIEVLEARMKSCRERASNLDQRLKTVREQIEAWDQKEVEWQKRVSRRLRILWAVMGTAVLFLAVMGLVDRFKPSLAPQEALGATDSWKTLVSRSAENETECGEGTPCLEDDAHATRLISTSFASKAKEARQSLGPRVPTSVSEQKDPEDQIQRVLDEL